MQTPSPIDFPQHRSRSEILEHPNFEAARNALVRSTLALYDAKPSLSRMLQEAGRNSLFVVIMCLNAAYDEEDRATWPTLQLVTRKTASMGVSSERRIHDLIMEFEGAGFIELYASPRDRRTRLVKPTARMFAHDLDWLITHYLPLQVLFPEPGYGPIMARDQRFQIAQRAIAGNFLLMAGQLFASHQLITSFLMRHAGIMLLIKLIELDTRGRLNAAVSYADMGETFGASRTQVRKLLQEAAACDLLTLTTDNPPHVKLTARLYEAFDLFVAEGMSGHDLIYQLAIGELSREPLDAGLVA